ncbi:MAG: sulfurtransferase [Actinomycetota bacterium]|nr:sulfurtransferase [Actinomycetota bacterium]
MEHPTHPEVLVDGLWLSGHLDDPNVRVIDIHLDPTSYEGGRIPGAVYWPALTSLLGPDFRTNSDTDAIDRLLGQSGIAEETMVVVCSDHRALGAWGFWFLKMIGHDRVRVLDGGMEKWRREARPLTTDVPDVDAVESHSTVHEHRRRILLEQVLQAVDNSESVLLDVRTPEEWRGEIFVVAPPQPGERGGHIPGAVHLYYESALNDDGTFKTDDELSEMYQAHGLHPGKQIITYCAVGMRSAHAWFVLSQLLGWPNVSSFDGSWNQWGRLADTPIEAA